MDNFLCLKETTKFLWGIRMQAHHEQERPKVSEWLVFKSYLSIHI